MCFYEHGFQSAGMFLSVWSTIYHLDPSTRWIRLSKALETWRSIAPSWRHRRISEFKIFDMNLSSRVIQVWGSLEIILGYSTMVKSSFTCVFTSRLIRLPLKYDMSGHVTFESHPRLAPRNLKSHRSKFQERTNLLHDECQKLQQHTQNFTTYWPNTRLSFHEIPGCWGRMSRSTGQISTTGWRTAVWPESPESLQKSLIFGIPRNSETLDSRGLSRFIH